MKLRLRVGRMRSPIFTQTRQCVFLFTPRGLGFATATTSATFLPHCEHRIRVARGCERHLPAHQPGERLGLNVPGRPARAGDAHEEVAEAVVEPLETENGRLTKKSDLCVGDALRTFAAMASASGSAVATCDRRLLPRLDNVRRLGVKPMYTVRKPTFVLLAVACITSLYSAVSTAGDLSSLAGHYRYEQYSVTLPSGRVLALSDLGATEAFLDISDRGSITLRMTMKAGNTVRETAKVVEAHFAQGRGYWIAQ
jgi:hypothetical protein